MGGVGGVMQFYKGTMAGEFGKHITGSSWNLRAEFNITFMSFQVTAFSKGVYKSFSLTEVDFYLS